jgi:hypothetical protein
MQIWAQIKAQLAFQCCGGRGTQTLREAEVGKTKRVSVTHLLSRREKAWFLTGNRKRCGEGVCISQTVHWEASPPQLECKDPLNAGSVVSIGK